MSVFEFLACSPFKEISLAAHEEALDLKPKEIFSPGIEESKEAEAVVVVYVRVPVGGLLTSPYFLADAAFEIRRAEESAEDNGRWTKLGRVVFIPRIPNHRSRRRDKTTKVVRMPLPAGTSILGALVTPRAPEEHPIKAEVRAGDGGMTAAEAAWCAAIKAEDEAAVAAGRSAAEAAVGALKASYKNESEGEVSQFP